LAKRRYFRDPRWAWWQVYCADAQVGRPVWAVSENQAVRIVLGRTGRVMIGYWHAKQTSQTLATEQQAAVDLAEIREAFPLPRRRRLRCANCGYFDPSPMADVCPNCGALRYQNPD
jgi:hypothetical protein